VHEVNTIVTVHMIRMAAIIQKYFFFIIVIVLIMIWFLSVPDAAAAALVAYVNLVAAAEAAGADPFCLAAYQQMRLVL
jgi:hypothetical protein